MTVDYWVRGRATPQPSLAPLKPPPNLPRNSLGLRSWSKSTPDLIAGQGAMKEQFHLPCSFLVEIYGLVLPLCFFMLLLNIVYVHN